MKQRRSRLLLIVFGLLATAIPVLAHHSFTAEFDGSKEFVVKGVLTRYEWTNPHVYYYVDVTNAQGKVTTYTFQGGPPNMMHRAGMRRSDIKIGEAVEITAAPAKDGTKAYGWLKMIKYPDGHLFVYRNGSE